MVQNFRKNWILLFYVFIFSGASSSAQWKTQEFELSAGQNAIYLTVQPEPREWDLLLANESRIERIWMWNRQVSSVQFTVSPDISLATLTDWQVWLPRDHPESFLRSLATAVGNMAYIIEVPEGTPTFTWRLKGRPLYPNVEWNRDALNLVGFSLNSDSLPTLQQFLSHSADIDDTIRSFEDSAFEFREGEVRDLRTLLMRRMKSGGAYWLRSETISDYAGPLTIADSSDANLDFGISITEREVHFRNDSEHSSFTLTIRVIPSELPPNNFGAGQENPRDFFDDLTPEPDLAGPVPLSYYDPEIIDNAVVGWIKLEGPPIQKTLEPGETYELRLAVRRADFTPYIPVGLYGSSYQSLLLVEDSLGMNRYYLPVSATTEDLAE